LRVIEIGVYKVDWEKMDWVEVKRLQDCTAFIDFSGKAPIVHHQFGSTPAYGFEAFLVYGFLMFNLLIVTTLLFNVPS
jgi:hypothetical protein